MKIDVAFEDIRAGDYVTLSYKGHEFSGVAWAYPAGEAQLRVGGSYLKRYDGRQEELGFVSASREVKLPTGIGAVIRDGIGDIYIRIGEGSWRRTRTPEGAHGDSDVTFNMPFEVLSEGVEIE